MTQDELKVLIEDLRLNHEYCPKEVILQAADELERLAQPSQEPVAVKHMMEWVDYLKRKSDYGQHMRIPSEMSAGACWELAIELEQFINTTPPQRNPLTDEEISDLWCEASNTEFVTIDTHVFARAIEAAHGIKE